MVYQPLGLEKVPDTISPCIPPPLGYPGGDGGGGGGGGGQSGGTGTIIYTPPGVPPSPGTNQTIDQIVVILIYGGGGALGAEVFAEILLGAGVASAPADVPLNPFAQAVFSRVYKTLNGLDPEPCGGGTFGFRGIEVPLGPAKFGTYLTFTRDSRSGTWLGVLGELGYNPVSVGYEYAGNLGTGAVEGMPMVFVGGRSGVFGGFSTSQIQLGVYSTAGAVGGGPYVNLVPGGTCHP